MQNRIYDTTKDEHVLDFYLTKFCFPFHPDKKDKILKRQKEAIFLRNGRDIETESITKNNNFK